MIINIEEIIILKRIIKWEKCCECHINGAYEK